MILECVESQRLKDDWGYVLIWDGEKLMKEHLLVFLQHHGSLPEVVMHTCDNPACINIEHLQPGTHVLNNQDRMQKGRNGRIDGQRNGRSKVSDDQAEEIRHRYAGRRTAIRSNTSR